MNFEESPTDTALESPLNGAGNSDCVSFQVNGLLNQHLHLKEETDWRLLYTTTVGISDNGCAG